MKRLIKPLVARPRVARWLSRMFLHLDFHLDAFLNELLPYAEGGVHPKHRLMDYHRFFVDNVSEQDRVLDVGCGKGTVAASIARKARSVTGIDLNFKNIAYAKAHYHQPNLTFVVGDALRKIPAGQYDVIVLSNVLEHIDKRVDFLKQLAPLANKILIRVPMITRDWKPLYRREIGLDHRMDDTHFIEYTEPEFLLELDEAGFERLSLSVQFGEIWAVTQPLSPIPT